MLPIILKRYPDLGFRFTGMFKTLMCLLHDSKIGSSLEDKTVFFYSGDIIPQ